LNIWLQVTIQFQPNLECVAGCEVGHKQRCMLHVGTHGLGKDKLPVSKLLTSRSWEQLPCEADRWGTSVNRMLGLGH
jgi:hypothetical protein